MVHKKEMLNSKEVTDVQGEDDDSSKMKEVKDQTELVICEKQAEEDDKEEGGCSEENEGNEDKGESVIHKIDTVETIHLDTLHDLVIDESVCANGQIMKSVTFDLEHKEDDGLRNASSTSLSVKTMHETLPRDDKEDSEKGNESLESSDTIPPEDIKNDDEFDSEDDIPLTQNIQRPRYIKSEMQEDEEIEGVFSDNNTEPDGKWGKLKLGDKLKRYLLFIFYCFSFFFLPKSSYTINSFWSGLKVALCLCSGYCVGDHILVEIGHSCKPAKVSM